MNKKIYITEKQYNQLFDDKKKNKSQSKSKRDINMDCMKAARKKSREEAREIYGDGFKATTKVAKSEKNYSRKGKNRFDGRFDDEW